jgi:hypothetical protein
LEEKRKEFESSLDKLKTNAQDYLDKKYPLNERSWVTSLHIMNEHLIGCLKLTGFNNLLHLNCYANQLTSLDFLVQLNPIKLTQLDVQNNEFSNNDLIIFRSFINLEVLRINDNS